MFRIYTNDLELERAKQASVENLEDAAARLMNRVVRAKSRKLAAIALVAKERGDEALAKAARARMVELGDLKSNQGVAKAVEIVESRRASKSKASRALAAA